MRTLTLPTDKAIAHRALLCAALSGGVSTIRPLPSGADVATTMQVLRDLGVAVTEVAGVCDIHGVAGRWPRPEATLHCHDSGTTLRLLLGVLAGRPGRYTIRVGAQLARRPIARVVEPLQAMGAELVVRDWGTASACIEVRGTHLHAITYRLPVASAQVKDALRFAAMAAQGTMQLEEPSPTRDHLDYLLRAFGSCCERSADIDLPGDPSAAAPWIVATLLGRTQPLCLPNVGLNPTRLGLVRALRAMGARIEIRAAPPSAAAEPRGELVIHPGALRGATIPADQIPTLIDEIPLLVLAAGPAHGETRIVGVAELRHKESDRLTATLEICRSAGLEVQLNPAGDLMITGRPGQRFRPPQCPRTGDHRMVILAALIERLAGYSGATQVPDPGAVDKSYPEFWRDLDRVLPAPAGLLTRSGVSLRGA